MDNESKALRTGSPARRAVLGLGLLGGVAAVLGGCDADDTPAGPLSTGANTPPAKSLVAEPSVSTPAEAWARLEAGNARFAAGTVTHPDATGDRREQLAGGQHPFATVFSCVDSRVPPELVFDQGLGDLFVIRSAGHVTDHAVLGSLEYGVAELKIPFLLVLGHEKCGAVKATIEAVEKHSPAGGTDIDDLVAGIRPAVEKAKTGNPADLLDATVRTNTQAVVAALAGKSILGEAVKAGTLKIAGARYDLDTGTVELL
jgi:carbonic anhydrase